LSSEPLRREIGLFGAVMLVIGGIVGAGVFRNPSVVAGVLHAPFLILVAWGFGGVVALLGAFIYAELAARMPDTGGEYAYLSQTYGPLWGFLFGWTSLLVVQAGGMAAVCLIFAENFQVLMGWQVDVRITPIVVAAALGLLTLVNCIGVKSGNETQALIGALKMIVIVGLVACGLFLAPHPQPLIHPILDRPVSINLVQAFGEAMIPVLFAFGGWQTANFVGGEIKDAHRNLTRALVIGVLAVTVLYLAVNVACLNTLGFEALGRTKTPVADVLQVTVGGYGARLVALAITLSTLGYLSQGLLTAPRVYYAMARDGYLLDILGKVSKRSQVPVAAILLTSVWTGLLAMTGTYEQIAAYDVSMNFIFFGLTATCLFALRRRAARTGVETSFRVPGHPWTTLAFILCSVAVIVSSHIAKTAPSLVGDAILLAGVPIYFLRRRVRRDPSPAAA
jgi:APA family basic amino acid/polyamine antiporter